MNELVTLVCLSVGFAVSLGFFFHYLQAPRYTAALWCGLLSVVFVAVGLFAFLLPQARAADASKSASGLTEAERVALRPYLDATDARLAPLEVGNIPQARITLENTGKTPAVDVLPGTKLQIGDLGFFPDGAYTAVDTGRVTLGSGKRVQITVPGDVPLTAEQFAGLSDGTKELMVHGEVRFTANPSQPIEPLRFCFTLDRTTGDLVLCDNRGFINRENSLFR